MQSFIHHLIMLLIGFSIISSIMLVFTHLRLPVFQGKRLAQIAGLVLLFGLALIQVSHLLFMQGQNALVESPIYTSVLFLVSPAFYFLSREFFQVKNSYHPLMWLHLAPLFISFVLPQKLILPFAFFTGTAYVVWLLKIVYDLRSQRQRFKLEFLSLVAMMVVASLVLVLGILLPLISDTVFYPSYAFLLGLAFIVIVYTLLAFPNVTNNVVEAAQAVYVNSTLTKLDSDALVLKLRQLLEVDKLFKQDSLSLSLLADQLEINSHQLSELINTRFAKSFSQLLREYRINEAKRLLIDEPNASVLSIGLSTGFTSQSNFYSAFKEITGMAPGNYRKSNNKKS